jgi:hypothetical protein
MPDKIYRSTAKQEYGLTDRELDTLPFTSVANPHYRSGPPAKIYLRDDIERLANSPAVIQRLKRKAARDDPAAKEARRIAREARILRRYPTWRDALLPACESMFNLNRYAKHESCRSRDEIYDLKNGLVELLYVRGFSTECRVHSTWLPEKICFACDGTGTETDYYGLGESDIAVGCSRCGGTGVYREAKELRFMAFRFSVDGQFFAWHQPDHLVGFEFVTTADAAVGGLAIEKPIEMTTAKMREGKVIIRYVLEGGQLEESAAVANVARKSKRTSRNPFRIHSM